MSMESQLSNSSSGCELLNGNLVSGRRVNPRFAYIEEIEELAVNGLRNNRHILDMITEELLEKSRITGLEVIEKMKDLSPVMFEDFVTPYQKNLEEIYKVQQRIQSLQAGSALPQMLLVAVQCR